MSDKQLIHQVCDTYAYHGQLGLAHVETPLCQMVHDHQHPEVWASNKVYHVQARTAAEIQTVMRDVEKVFAGQPYRHFSIDPVTSDLIPAYLALHNYTEHEPIMQMVLTGTLHVPMAAVECVPVVTETHWQQLAALARRDHEEGASTAGILVPESVTQGLVAGYRKKAGACQFVLALKDGIPCAYGSGTPSPYGMGMVENLFTLPTHRRQGIATTIIAHCVADLRAQGMGPILIGGYASASPKHLYHRLGFTPVCLTRSYIREEV